MHILTAKEGWSLYTIIAKFYLFVKGLCDITERREYALLITNTKKSLKIIAAKFKEVLEASSKVMGEFSKGILKKVNSYRIELTGCLENAKTLNIYTMTREVKR